MSKVRKSILIILTILIAIVIVITGIVILNLKKNENTSEEKHYHHSGEDLENIQNDAQIIEVNSRNRYYTVKNILNTYITYIQQINGIIGLQTYEGDEEVIQEGVDQVYNVLDSEYISSMNLDKESIKNMYSNYSNYEIELQKMYSYDISDRITIYFIYANMDNKDFNILIKTDATNMTFSVFLDDYINKNSYSEKMDVDNIIISDDKIEKNDYNIYRYINISDEYIVKQYVDSFKDNIINNTEYAYNNLLESDYKEKRFGSLDKFKEYVQENTEEIQNIEISKYQIIDDENSTEYICIDQYENYYVFKENAIMNYTFAFDTYTIITDKFRESYSNESDEGKVQMNIDKFFKMINRHDYKSSYECLSESFRNNYFKTEDEFKIYIKNTFFEYNKVIYKECSLSGNLYIYKLELEDITGQNTENKAITLIVKLNEEFEFELAINM